MALASKQQEAKTEAKGRQAAQPAASVGATAVLTVQDMFGWLRDEIKNLRTEFKSEIREVRDEVKGLRGEFKAEIQGLRGEFKEEIQGLRGEFKEEIQGLRTETREDNKELREETRGDIRGLREDIKGLQKQIWILTAIVVVAFFAGGDPENPILKGLFGLFGAR